MIASEAVKRAYANQKPNSSSVEHCLEQCPEPGLVQNRIDQMVFAREDISDEDKKKIGTISSPAVGPIYLTSWVADHERGAFLIYGGQDREPPHHSFFVFLMGGMRFLVEMTMNFTPATLGNDFECHLHSIDQVADGRQQKENVLQILKEALTAHARRAGPMHSINFDF